MASQPAAKREAAIRSLTTEEQEALPYCWGFWARLKQWAPDGKWRIWLRLAGRGEGKTRSGAEWIRRKVESGEAKRVALVAPTAADARDVMVEGDSGVLSISPPWFRPHYEPSKRRLTWPNGAIATTFSADEPDRLRGPQHDVAWADELAVWRRPEAWDMLLLGLRLGEDPRCVVTTTPKPVPHIVKLIENPACVVVRGTTYDNRENLAPAFFDEIVAQYEGTRLGRQEIYGELLDEEPGALWKGVLLDATRVTHPPGLKRIVVGVDPAAGVGDTGIVVAATGNDGHGYILDDVTIHGSPGDWSKAVLAAFHKWHADRIIAEANQGGDMVEHTMRTVDENAPIKLVHAAKGKQARAEPIAALYEQGRVHHVGFFADLEAQMRTWVPDEGLPSPDRMDALVWALTELMLDTARPFFTVVHFDDD